MIDTMCKKPPKKKAYFLFRKDRWRFSFDILRCHFYNRQGKYPNFNFRKLLCSALIQWMFDYASCSWFSGLNSKYQQKFQTTQNKMVCFMRNSTVVFAHDMLVKMNVRMLDT